MELHYKIVLHLSMGDEYHYTSKGTPNLDSLIMAVMNKEKCPRRSIVKIAVTLKE